MVDIQHTGVNCKFKPLPSNIVFGVPQTHAALAGTVVGILAVFATALYVESTALLAAISFVIGWTVLIPGAFTVKLLRKIQQMIAG